jgi:N-acetylglucosaminyldiphosphoundecaprenol N-acetyl-beta-D-mannosaminyltransferase
VDNQPERIMLLNIPLDIVFPDELPSVIEGLMYQSKKSRNIVLLSLWDLMRARRNNEYRDYLVNAAMVIPISKSLVSGAKLLTGKGPVRYMPFNFTISLLSILEKKGSSLFLLGGGTLVLKKAEKNLRSTFPQLNIVGRCDGKTYRMDEAAVIEAIRKSSPDLLLVGSGVREKELWIAKNSSNLNSGFRLWCSDLFDVIAEKRKRPSEAVFERGLESIGFCLRSPLKFFRIFVYLYYNLLLLYSRLFKKATL